jgi:ABC-type glycerol-3-phosphate transport system substrate-binding protein
MRPVSRAVVAAVISVLALAACGGGGENTAAPGGTTTTADVSVTGSAGPAVKVSANNASAEELRAAFEAAGIPDAERWAEEVEEYRPYPADDPNLTKLRQELEKYNPGPGVVDKIVATLQP